MTYFDYTLSILQNFQKTILMTENLNEVHYTLAKYIQNMVCGQYEVSKCQVYRHILKSIVMKLEEKNQEFKFVSSHAMCHAATPWFMTDAQIANS